MVNQSMCIGRIGSVNGIGICDTRGGLVLLYQLLDPALSIATGDVEFLLRIVHLILIEFYLDFRLLQLILQAVPFSTARLFHCGGKFCDTCLILVEKSLRIL